MANACWDDLFEAAEKLEQKEPALGGFLQKVIYNFADIGSSLACMIAIDFAGMVDYGTWFSTLVDLTEEEYSEMVGSVSDVAARDLQAIQRLDPAHEDAIHAYLFHKGFKALQAYRLSHALWRQGRSEMAYAVQARACEVYNSDIHPSAEIGPGTVLDRRCSLTIGYDVKIDHDCVLSEGTKIFSATLEPHVILGCNSSVSGLITIGAHTEISPCTAVMTSTEPHSFISSSSLAASKDVEKPTMKAKPAVQATRNIPSSTDHTPVRRVSVSSVASSRRTSITTSVTTPYSGKRNSVSGNSDPKAFTSRGLLKVKQEVDKEEIREELIRRKSHRERLEQLQREEERGKDIFLGLTAADLDHFANKKDKFVDYRRPTVDPFTESKVQEIKSKRDREREQMKLLIQERRQSIHGQGASEVDAAAERLVPLSVETIANEDAPTAIVEKEEHQTTAHAEQDMSFQEVDDYTLQLFYYYYDKFKAANGGNGVVQMPTKAQLLAFVMNRKEEEGEEDAPQEEDEEAAGGD